MTTAATSASEFLREDRNVEAETAALEIHEQTQKWLEGYARTKSWHNPREFKDLTTKIKEMEDKEIQRYRSQKLQDIQQRYYNSLSEATSEEEKLELYRAAKVASMAVHMSFPPISFKKDAILKQMRGHSVSAPHSRGLSHVEHYIAEEQRRKVERDSLKKELEHTLAREEQRIYHKQRKDRHHSTGGKLNGSPQPKDGNLNHPSLNPRPTEWEESPSYLDKIQEELRDYDAKKISSVAMSALDWTYKFWANILDEFPSRFEKRAWMIIEHVPKSLDNCITQPPKIMKTVEKVVVHVKQKIEKTIEEILEDDDDDDDF